MGAGGDAVTRGNLPGRDLGSSPGRWLPTPVSLPAGVGINSEAAYFPKSAEVEEGARGPQLHPPRR